MELSSAGIPRILSYPRRHAMKRRLLNLLTALSLMLCVAVGVLWVRSYYTGDWISRTNVRDRRDYKDASEWVFYSTDGLIVVTVGSYRWGEGPPFHSGPTEQGIWWRWESRTPGDLRDLPPFPMTIWYASGST
jgi:hypothetical protein